jgi:hypothetical protein
MLLFCVLFAVWSLDWISLRFGAEEKPHLVTQFNFDKGPAFSPTDNDLNVSIKID